MHLGIMVNTFLLGIVILIIFTIFGPLSIPVGILLYFTLVRQRKVTEDNLDVLIVGAGISGINIGKRLNDIGVRRYTILEQGSEVGGTWYWNKYPGCCSDVPAVLYSFSWHYNPSWTRRFPGADEIQVNLLQLSVLMFNNILQGIHS